MSFLKVFDVKNSKKRKKKTCMFVCQKEKERGEKSFCFPHSNNVIETKE